MKIFAVFLLLLVLSSALVLAQAGQKIPVRTSAPISGSAANEKAASPTTTLQPSPQASVPVEMLPGLNTTTTGVPATNETVTEDDAKKPASGAESSRDALLLHVLSIGSIIPLIFALAF
jgi:hypothetical protein